MSEESKNQSVAEAKAARPRLTKAERLEALKKRQDQLKAQIALLETENKTAERKRDARRKIIVGGAVLAHAELHPAFAAELRAALQAAVTRDKDKAVIRDLIGG